MLEHSIKFSLCCLGPLHTREWEPVTITPQTLSLVEKAELVQVRFTLRLMDQHSMWRMQKCVYTLHGFLHGIEWIMFHGHLHQFQKRQNQETMALQTLTIVDVFYSIMCESPCAWTFIGIAFVWGCGHIWLHTTPEDLWPYYMILEVSCDGLWTFSFGLSQFHGHISWLM